jgi:hypothetical protein
MATFKQDRVEHALNELLVRMIPEDADEDEDAANQRFEEAYDFALDELTAAGEPSTVPDINHTASLLDKRCMSHQRPHPTFTHKRSIPGREQRAEKNQTPQPALAPRLTARAGPEMAHAPLPE